MRLFSRWLLRQAEGLFLFVHGWKPLGDDWWDRPVDHPTGKTTPCRTGHALQSQKVRNSDRSWDPDRTVVDPSRFDGGDR